jgi:hypothetical protein
MKISTVIPRDVFMARSIRVAVLGCPVKTHRVTTKCLIKV